MSTIISQKADKGLSKDVPFHSKIISRIKLSKEGSSKATYHISMDLNRFHHLYSEGDAFAVFPRNGDLLVESLLDSLNLNPNEIIVHPKTRKTKTLKDFIQVDANLTKIPSKILSLFSEHSKTNSSAFNDLLNPANKEKQKLFLKTHDILSLSHTFKPRNISAQQLIESLLPMLPRFYSCASSYCKNAHAVDFLISTFKYEIQNSLRQGIGSDYLCHLAKEQEELIPIYLHKNRSFQLPQDPSVPIIMIGPGTGVAPFRAFMQKRLSQNATKNWLFFGERNYRFDFYFANEWLTYQKNGFLQLDLAFSRDQKEKIYVQNKLFEKRMLLLEWIKEGAIIYVCGDASRMEKDVRTTLCKIFETELNLNKDQALEYFKTLKKEHRYLTDIY